MPTLCSRVMNLIKPRPPLPPTPTSPSHHYIEPQPSTFEAEADSRYPIPGTLELHGDSTLPALPLPQTQIHVLDLSTPIGNSKMKLSGRSRPAIRMRSRDRFGRVYGNGVLGVTNPDPDSNSDSDSEIEGSRVQRMPLPDGYFGLSIPRINLIPPTPLGMPELPELQARPQLSAELDALPSVSGRVPQRRSSSYSTSFRTRHASGRKAVAASVGTLYRPPVAPVGVETITPVASAETLCHPPSAPSTVERAEERGSAPGLRRRGGFYDEGTATPLDFIEASASTGYEDEPSLFPRPLFSTPPLLHSPPSPPSSPILSLSPSFATLQANLQASQDTLLEVTTLRRHIRDSEAIDGDATMYRIKMGQIHPGGYHDPDGTYRFWRQKVKRDIEALRVVS